MHRMILIAAALTGAAAATSSQGPPSGMPAAATYARVYCGADGTTRFADENAAFSLKEYAPPAAPVGVSAPMEAKTMTFLVAPPGYVGDWHPASAPQFIIALSGTTEIEVGDGEVRRFGPGSILFNEDTDCRGHITRTVGDAPATVVAVVLPSQ